MYIPNAQSSELPIRPRTILSLLGATVTKLPAWWGACWVVPSPLPYIRLYGDHDYYL